MYEECAQLVYSLCTKGALSLITNCVLICVRSVCSVCIRKECSVCIGRVCSFCACAQSVHKEVCSVCVTRVCSVCVRTACSVCVIRVFSVGVRTVCSASICLGTKLLQSLQLGNMRRLQSSAFCAAHRERQTNAAINLWRLQFYNKQMCAHRFSKFPREPESRLQIALCWSKGAVEAR